MYAITFLIGPFSFNTIEVTGSAISTQSTAKYWGVWWQHDLSPYQKRTSQKHAMLSCMCLCAKYPNYFDHLNSVLLDNEYTEEAVTNITDSQSIWILLHVL